MKPNLKAIRKLRVYPEDLKKELVATFESGKFSVLQLEKLYGIPNVSIYNWIYKYSSFNDKGYRVMESKSSTSNKLKELSQKVRDLEQAIGQKQIMIDYLEKMIELAKTDLNIDIKKNYSTPPSAGSASAKKS